ncbi:MAG: enoyl-CoA hydratase-related protein [Dehalococcoidia bacterium]
MVRRVESCRHPTIAAVQGAAIAGGCELALHCDLRVVADNAQFAMPLARLGIVLPLALTQKLVEIVGPAFTRQILFTARPVTAQRAFAIGMVHDLVPLGELEGASMALAKTIAANAPLSLIGMKATIQRTMSLRESISSDDLTDLVLRARDSADAQEGVRAQLERRLPVFRGE